MAVRRAGISTSTHLNWNSTSLEYVTLMNQDIAEVQECKDQLNISISYADLNFHLVIVSLSMSF